MQDFLELVAAILVAIGATGGIVYGLSKWLGGIFAKRIEHSHRAKLAKENAYELDLLARRREVYSSMIKSMRVFLSSSNSATEEEKKKFLRAYDECCIWAPDEVLEAIGHFLDLNMKRAKDPNSVGQSEFQKAYKECIKEIRKDSGFIETEINYRFVSF